VRYIEQQNYAMRQNSSHTFQFFFSAPLKKDLFGKPQKVKSQDYWEQIVALSKKKRIAFTKALAHVRERET
jgi:hypothetical protein